MKLRKRLVATMLSVLMMASVVVQPLSMVSATTGEIVPIVEGSESGNEQPPQILVITSASLNQGEEAQTIAQGSDKAVNLPKVDVTYADGTTESIDVTWTPNTAFDVNAAGIYTYSAAIDETKYSLAEGVTLPNFTVTVEAAVVPQTTIKTVASITALQSDVEIQNITVGSGVLPVLPALEVVLSDGATEL